jgi:hypothetical protein
VPKEVDEVRNLRDLLFWESADLLEEVLFLERITHGCIVLQRAGWRGSARHRKDIAEVEQGRDFGFAHAVEILGRGDLACQKAQLLLLNGRL